MPTTYRRYQPDQPLLLPPDLQEWVPPGHLAHHVSDVVDALDLTSFYAPYEGDGRRNAPYEPSMMVKVLIYAYATGTFSSRAVARKLEEDVAFRMLAAGNFPQHRTVCEFRCRHLAAQQAIDGPAGGLATDVPQRHVEAAHGDGAGRAHAVARQLHLVDAVPDADDVAGVHAKGERLERRVGELGDGARCPPGGTRPSRRCLRPSRP